MTNNEALCIITSALDEYVDACIRYPSNEEYRRALTEAYRIVSAPFLGPDEQPADFSREHEDMFVCGNCSKEFYGEDGVPAEDLSQRLTVGEPYTDIECPVCGALAWPVKG